MSDPDEAHKETRKRANSQLATWSGIGVAIGVALGAALGNIGIGIAIGVAVGAAIGSARDAKNRK
jgi:F0F1-type ATP synthase membrane subunit c/vacuolar-type H+-ATPase subunit K